MKQKTVMAVCNYWNLIEDDDISTERLLEMCRQEFNFEDCSDVITALVKGGILKEQTNDNE